MMPAVALRDRRAELMDMHPPPAYVQFAQAEEPETPVEPTPIKVDVSSYIPAGATSVTIIVTLTPPTGQALVYTEGAENYGTVFRGARSVGDIRLDGPVIYVKLYGATSFAIQYLNYRVP
jgi:hypothetical protein